MTTRALAAAHRAGEDGIFAEQCGGIQFVYDHWMDKIILTDWDADEAHRHVTLYISEGQYPDLLSREEIGAPQRVRVITPRRRSRTSPSSVSLRKGGKDLPYTLKVRTIWPSDDGAYTCLVGQFLPK